jgi:hypothetical protein
MTLVAACGPAPNPKLAAKSEPAAEPAPAVAEPQPQPAPVAAPVVEEPRPRVVATPRREAPVKTAPARPAPAPRAAASVASRPAPAAETASGDPRTINLPAPIAPPVLEPLPPPDEIQTLPPAPEPPAPRVFRVPSGTIVGVRMIDSVDSETASEGETFKASLDSPILLDNETVFPKGSQVYVKLSKVQSAGRVSGRSELQLELDRIFLGSKSYSVESSKYVTTGASQGGRTARSAGVGAAIGAAIGAISGGGKGAIIGGATGAGAGAGVEAVRKGEQVRVDSETRLDFRLEDSVEVTLQSPNSPQRNNPSGPPRFGTRQ